MRRVDMREVSYARDAAKALQRMDRASAKRIRDKLRQYADDPTSLANNVKALKSNDGLKRLRVGDWRVIFIENLVIVMVVRVAARGSVYD